MPNWLNEDAGIPTSSRQGYKGEPVTDVSTVGNKLIAQKTEADLNAGQVSFSQNVHFVELFNYGPENGTFNVNGIPIMVPGSTAIPGGGSFRAEIGGTPSPNITVTGATTFIVSLYE